MQVSMVRHDSFFPISMAAELKIGFVSEMLVWSFGTNKQFPKR
jgi:hypothetical protein